MAKKDFWTLLGEFKLSGFILGNLGYIFFLGFLAILLIGNAHLAERNLRKIETLKPEIQRLQWSYKSLKSENMYNSLRSEVAERVKDEGLRLHRGEPVRIIVKEEED